MKGLFVRNRLFLLIILPLGVICAVFPEQLSTAIGRSGLLEGTTENLGVAYLLFSIVILTIESKINKKRQNKNEA